jgi:His/Glu/Gln/Arg/opine family amino acid ABC transporter permease subunit
VIGKKTRITTTDLVLLAGIGAAVMWLLYQATVHAQYKWNWQAIPQYLLRVDEQSGRWVPGLILQGVLVTLRLSIWATVLALILGTVMGLFRTGCSRYRRMIGSGYVELIRNIPVLVWIFIFYYFIGDRLLPALGISRITLMDGGPLSGILSLLMAEPSRMPIFISGAVALAVYEGAYITEIIRAGIQSIDNGQWEASSGFRVHPGTAAALHHFPPGPAPDHAAPGRPVHLNHQGLGHRIGDLHPGTDFSGHGTHGGHVSHIRNMDHHPGHLLRALPDLLTAGGAV